MLESLFWLAIVVGVYFLPLIVAVLRSHDNAGAISVLNLLAGWTILGWLVAIVWAFTNRRPA